MAYVLLAIGIVLGYLDYLGTANLKAAGSLVYQETFGGTNPYYKWAGAMIIVGLMGYVPEMEPIATSLLILILLVLILSHSSGFSTLVKGV